VPAALARHHIAAEVLARQLQNHDARRHGCGGGLIIDDAIVMVEHVIRRCARAPKRGTRSCGTLR